MDVVAIRCLTDNYCWWLPELGVLVDPSEAGPVHAAGVVPRAIWLTHHHPDHVGGVPELAEAFPGIPVYASAYDMHRIPGATHPLSDGDTVGPARIIEVPGHTLGAIAYVMDRAVFTGDTLFAAGCGRLFEGTPEQMVTSLSRLRTLPDDTQVYCGHEYTAKNCAFGASVDPGWTREARPVPSTMGEERATNVFLRWDDAALAAHHAVEVGVPLFAHLRALRNRF